MRELKIVLGLFFLAIACILLMQLFYTWHMNTLMVIWGLAGFMYITAIINVILKKDDKKED